MSNTPRFIRVGRNFDLDGEETYRLLIELGTFPKVVGNLAQQGKINGKTGKPYNKSTVQYTTWNWVLINPDYAYKILLESGAEVTEEYWRQFLVQKAFTRFVNIGHSRKRFVRWLKDHDLEEFSNYRKPKYFEDKDTVS